MKLRFWGILGCILLSIPLKAESLAGYYLRFLRNESIFGAMTSLVYVFCGVLSFYNLSLAFQKFAEGDAHAGRNARNWCLSLLLIAVCTFFLTTLVTDSRSLAQINLGDAVRQVTGSIHGTFEVVSRLVYVICGIIGLMVLPGKFRALQEGHRHAGRAITSWGLGLVSVVSLVFIIHKIFFQ
jgi:uncharacterized membrane protein YuzA (DUF378 family)